MDDTVTTVEPEVVDTSVEVETEVVVELTTTGSVNFGDPGKLVTVSRCAMGVFSVARQSY